MLSLVKVLEGAPRADQASCRHDLDSRQAITVAVMVTITATVIVIVTVAVSAAITAVVKGCVWPPENKEREEKERQRKERKTERKKAAIWPPEEYLQGIAPAACLEGSGLCQA